MPGKKKKYNARFPPARIKKIMQSDEEVGKVAAAVPVIISRALELFVENMLKKANEVTSRRGARTLTPSHLKMCINSESRFDFLKDLVSGVSDLQGDMDINLDSAPTGNTVGELLSPVTTPSTTSSSMTWPGECSRGSSTTLPSNVSATSAIATSSSISSPLALSTAAATVSPQYPKCSLKNSNNKNNTSPSRGSSSYQNRLTLQTSYDESSSSEQKDSLNTKVVRKRGRPRKSSTDPTSSNKPKKPKTSPQEEARHHHSEHMHSIQALQYSASHSKPLSEDVHTDPDEEARTNSENETKSHMKLKHMKSKSLSENPAVAKLQVLRTYSTGSSASPSTPSIPSFTLTFPIVPPNKEQAKSITKTDLKKSKNNTKASSSQLESQQPKLKNNSKGVVRNSQNLSATPTPDQITSNNGFPFTISKILENDPQTNKKIVMADNPEANAAKGKEIGRESLPVQTHVQNNIAPQPITNASTLTKVGVGKTSSNNVSEKTSFPTVSWTMNVVAPIINTSADIDEDYDA